MMQPTPSRFQVPSVEALPEDIRERLLHGDARLPVELLPRRKQEARIASVQVVD